MLVILAAGSALALVSQLERPWVRQQLQALARRQTGLELDYGAVQLGNAELTLHDVVVRSPKSVRVHAPELLRVGRLRVAWSGAALARGVPWLTAELGQVSLTVVTDEHGHSSLDALSPPSPAQQPSAPTPLSQQPASALASGFPLRRLQASDVQLRWLRTAQGQLAERVQLTGLALTLTGRPAPVGASLHVSIGAAKEPRALALARTLGHGAEHTAALRVRLELDASSTSAVAWLEARVAHQSFAPDLSLDTLARLHVRAKFEPALQQTALTLSQLDLVDRALTARAELVLPDQRAPRVRHAVGDLDAPRLLALAQVWALPLRLRAGHLHYRIDDLELDRPAPSARVALEGELRGVALSASDSALDIGALQLSLQGRPSAAGLELQGKARLDRLRAVRGVASVQADDVALTLSGLQQQQGALTGQVLLRFSTIAAGGLTAHEGRLTLSARDLVADAHTLMAARGDLRMRADIATLEAAQTRWTDTELSAHLPLTGGAPLNATVELGSPRLERSVADHAPLSVPVSMKLQVRALRPDLAQPARSLAKAELTVEAGALQARVEADKQQDALDYTLRASAAELSQLASLLPASEAQRVRWSEMALTLQSRGRLERLAAAPTLRQQSELALTRLNFDDVTARELSLTLHAQGSLSRHALQADVQVAALRRGQDALGHEHLALRASFDQQAPALHVEVKSLALPNTLLDATLRFERKKRVVHYALAGHLSELSALSTLLSQERFFSGVDVSDLDIRFQAQGSLTGVVSSVDARGIRWTPAPLRTWGGHASAEVSAKGMRWARDDLAVSIPALQWRMRLQEQGERRLLESDLSAEQLDAALGQRHIAVEGLRDQAQVTMTGGLEGTLEHHQQLSLRALQQDFVPGYGIGDVTGSLVFSRQGDGLIKLTELRLSNPRGGTHVAVSGGLELTLDERRLSLRSTVEQDLTRLSTRPEELEGQGKLSFQATLSSPDLKLFHALATLRLADATLRLPREQVALEAMNGELPVRTDFILDEQGVELLRGARVNPYAAQRFADQHPLLGHRSYLSIGKVVTPWVQLSPFAANLEVARNIVSLSQIEVGVRGGTITGNGSLEYDGLDSKLDANVRASGVKSSHGEPFDGNAALLIGIRERTVEGRADILRIGRRHLQDLLDLQDPLRADPSINQVRTALRFGYPDRVRLSFQSGFASAGVDFAGLARLIKLRDIRGIPLGPLMERVMSSVQPTAVEP